MRPCAQKVIDKAILGWSFWPDRMAWTMRRLGLAISVKSAGNAVARNRLKRTCRESFRLRQHELVGWDVVVMARHGAAQLSGESLRQSLDRHWRRLISRAKVPVHSLPVRP